MQLEQLLTGETIIQLHSIFYILGCGARLTTHPSLKAQVHMVQKQAYLVQYHTLLLIC